MSGRPVLVFGAGGHGRVVADAARAAGYELVAFVDEAPALAGMEIWGVPVISWKRCRTGRWRDAPIAVGVGNNAVRECVQARIEAAGREVLSVVHARATVAPTAWIGAGTVIMAGAVVNPDAVVGRGCIVNTCAIVEHDCELAGFVHLSPNVSLGGAVSIGARTHLGLGAVILPRLRVGADVTVGAGAVVTRPVSDALTVVGVPARPLDKRGRAKRMIFLSVPHLGGRKKR